MRTLTLSIFLTVGLALVGSQFVGVPGAGAATAGATRTVEFNRDVRPFLSDTCFKCHGFDKHSRKADLRLDTPEDALAQRTAKDGRKFTPVIPGDAMNSEAYQRLISKDPKKQMPPPDSGLKLSPAQIEMYKQWIDQGAKYQKHWAFIPPQRSALPNVQKADWAANSIDRFVLAKLEQENLHPSPQADKVTLIRRVTLDLTGLPPTPAEVDAFVADTSPQAYEKVVDRLLNSPQYGERMALEWLDAARYADTHGYHIDAGRDMSVWREWVINAFATNMPFDRFTVEQIAGDLLPNATLDQKVASGFNRNSMINFEGGANAQEYLTQYLIDRVNTTSTVWLGLTVGCSQCHDHKYDPITQKDFYKFFAFFNAVPENGLDGSKGNAAPLIRAPTAAQRTVIADLTEQIAALEAKVKQAQTDAAANAVAWAQTASTAQTDIKKGLVAHYLLNEGKSDSVAEESGKFPAGHIIGKAQWATGKSGSALKFDGATHVDLGDTLPFERSDAFSYGAWVQPITNEHGTILARIDDPNAGYRGYDLYLGDGKLYMHLIHAWPDDALRVNTIKPLSLNVWHHVMATYDGTGKAAGAHLYVDGAPAELEVTHDSLTGSLHNEKHLQIGSRSAGPVLKGMIDDVRIYNRELGGGEVAAIAGSDPLAPVLALPETQRTPAQKQAIVQRYLETQNPGYNKIAGEIAALKAKLTSAEQAAPTTMVMAEMAKPRDTFVLERGVFDKPDKNQPVTAGVPSFLPPIPQGQPSNRLGLARWLVDPGNPLMARVTVNRFWQMYFGTGIVKTVEDLGSQGDQPSHPELLDWLATEFVQTGWDVKKMQKLIVMSATYRQSAVITPQMFARDPENRLLAHGPRFRLKAEFIRDQALAVSGLLDRRIGGASVSPYQPTGIWEELAFRADFKNWSAQTYTQSHGSDLYRRTMYTFWKRTVPPPTLSTFDAPDRETCTVRRAVTNTPLQALVLMNDPTYIEAARKLAERMMTEGGTTADQRIAFAFRLAIARKPTDKEIAILTRVYNQQLEKYAKDADATTKLLTVGESPRNEKLAAPELAAWTMVATTLLNLDETITKG